MKTIASLILTTSLLAAPVFAAGKKPFTVRGEFIDSCSCNIGCSCPMGKFESGCQGIGVIIVKSGTFAGGDMAGTKIAYAVAPGKWVRGYVDAPDAAKANAASEFAKVALAGFGKVEFVKPARVAVSGSNGAYTYSVNGGKTMKASTRMVPGADGHSPIMHVNLPDPLNGKLAQGRTLSGSYSDAGRSFTLKGTNSYYNTGLKKSGRL
jgi:hypothetical protein